MRIIIIDDDALVVQSLSTILSVESDIEVVATGHSGPEALTLYREYSPDILLTDIRMPEGDGLTAAEQILQANPQARIVLLTTFSEDDYIVRALQLGVRGYLIKQDIAQIAPALRSVMAGVSVLEGHVIERTTALGLAGNGGENGSANGGRSPLFASLTEREYEVVEAVAQGLDNAEIADQLFMSEGTVRNHISSILAKVGLRNRTQIAVAYYRGE
ncbi:MAG: response regulator transcription factor [Actinomycetaceae bacterium]|nr:response regulator transcription factor [Actinomycetaceae bacterium]